jgi:hypothetical protein
MFAELLDIVRGIAFAGGLVDPVENPLDMVKAEQKRT